MNETIFSHFLNGLLEQGFSSILFAIAIWYLQRQLDKLDSKIAECEKDRQKLWEKLTSKKL